MECHPRTNPELTKQLVGNKVPAFLLVLLLLRTANR